MTGFGRANAVIVSALLNRISFNFENDGQHNG